MLDRLLRRVARAQGVAFDALLIAAVAAVSEDAIEAWLLEHPRGLYYGLSAIHLVAMPALLVVIVAGWGRAGSPEELQRRGPGLLTWAMVLVWAGGFIVPGALAMSLDVQLWVMMTTVFGPIAVFAAWTALLIVGERRGWIAPLRIGQRPARWKLHAMALLTWAYLLWMETMLVVAAAKGGAIAAVIPLGVLIDYLPVRIVLYYIRDSSRWERYTIALSVLHLLWRISAA